jgi:hypothetical protein
VLYFFASVRRQNPTCTATLGGDQAEPYANRGSRRRGFGHKKKTIGGTTGCPHFIPGPTADRSRGGDARGHLNDLCYSRACA